MKNRKLKIIFTAIISLLLAPSCFAQIIKDQNRSFSDRFPDYLQDTTIWFSVALVVLFIFVIYALQRAVLVLSKILLPEEVKEKETVSTKIRSDHSSGWKKFMKSMTASVSVEKEADILLDHNYDGIRELDNQLPPWWKWGFYATIAFAIFY